MRFHEARMVSLFATWYEKLCAKASGAILCQTPEHEPDHGHVHPGFFTAREYFVVLGEPTPRGEPGEGSLGNPTPFEHVEAPGADLLPIDDRVLWRPDATLATPGMLHHLHFPAERLLDPLDEVAFLVRAVDPDQLEPRKTAAQWLQEVFAALVILKTGLMHQHMEDQTQGVDEHVPFPPFHFLATVIPASPPISLVFTD